MCAWSTPALCQEGETKCLFSWISPGFFLTPLNIVLYCVSHKCRSSRVRRATVWCFRSGGALCWERNNKKKKLHRHSACVWSPCLSGSLKGKVQTKKEKLGHYLLTNLGEVSYTSRHVSWASRPQQRCSVLLNDRSGWGLVLKRKKCSFSVSIEVSRSPAPSHIDLKNHVAGTLFSKQKSLLSLLSWKRRGAPRLNVDEGVWLHDEGFKLLLLHNHTIMAAKRPHKNNKFTVFTRCMEAFMFLVLFLFCSLCCELRNFNQLLTSMEVNR